MLSEIGSEFWYCKNLINANHKNTYDMLEEYEIRTTLSGRTSLDMIIEDIIADKGRFKVYMPSYACHTMIEPFLYHGLKIEFYTVTFDNRLIFDFKFDNECDVIFILNYFGYIMPEVNEIANEQKKRGKTIIYDNTQTAFCENHIPENADYIFTSYRKWYYTNFSTAGKRGYFKVPQYEDRFDEYIYKRNSAMDLKEKYIGGCDINKNTFLEMYSDAEKMLDNNYRHYAADRSAQAELEFLDITALRKARRKNAEVLTEGIKEFSDLLVCAFHKVNEQDCPLFVPVIIDKRHRDNLRKRLIDEKIYCPVHWPLTDIHPKGGSRDLLERELSLICDQRYDSGDMQKILNVIKGYCERI